MILSRPTDTRVLQLELEQLIKDCDLTTFEQGYGVLDPLLKTPQERAAVLAAFSSCAQATKDQKLIDFSHALARSVQSRWHFVKGLVQLIGTGIVGTVTGAAVSMGFFDVGSTNIDDVTFLQRASPFLALTTVVFAYVTVDNFSMAFCYADAIKKDIAALDDIMLFIKQMKEQRHCVTGR